MQDFELIETPENVELEQPLAGIGSRFIAGLIDNILIAGIYLLLIALFFVARWTNPLDFFGRTPDWDMWGVAILMLCAFLVYWGYFFFFEAFTNGRSPGKKSLKIRVVKEGGGAITITDIAIRSLLRTVDAMPFGYAVGGVSMFLTRKVQRLGDLAAGTVVISEQTADYSARTDKRVRRQWEHEANPAGLRATGLTPQEYQLLSNYWARREQLTLQARQRVLPRLLRPILERTGAAVPGGSWMALEEYVESLMRKAMSAEEGTPPERSTPEGKT